MKNLKIISTTLILFSTCVFASEFSISSDSVNISKDKTKSEFIGNVKLVLKDYNIKTVKADEIIIENNATTLKRNVIFLLPKNAKAITDLIIFSKSNKTINATADKLTALN